MMLRRVAMIAVACVALSVAASAETIAVIGTGTVGSTLGPLWAAQGHTIVYGSRAPDSDKVKALVKETPKSSAALPQAAAQKAHVVLLALPGNEVVRIVASLGDLKGKVLIDPTNILARKDGKLQEPDTKESVVEQIQAAAPGAFAVKAFSTLGMVAAKSPARVGGRLTLPIVGNDAGAKAEVAALARSLGLEVIDLGALDMGRYVEQLGRLYVAYSMSHGGERLEYDFHTWKP